MRRLLLGVALAAAAILSIPAAASGAEYEGFVGCDASAPSPTPALTCPFESNPGAFFEADEATTYDLCALVPNGDVFCLKEERDVAAGALDSVPLPRKEAGSYFLVWFVGEDPVAEWEFALSAAIPPPPPPPAPAPAPVVPVVTGPTQGCVKAQKRVKQLRTQLQNTSGKKQKARLRAKLKGARTAARKAC